MRSGQDRLGRRRRLVALGGLRSLAQGEADEGEDQGREHRGADQTGGGRAPHVAAIDGERGDRYDKGQLSGRVEGEGGAVTGGEHTAVEEQGGGASHDEEEDEEEHQLEQGAKRAESAEVELDAAGDEEEGDE